MNDEVKKDFIIGMLVGLAGSFKSQFTSDQSHIYVGCLSNIDEIYYPKKELSKPITRSIE